MSISTRYLCVILMLSSFFSVASPSKIYDPSRDALNDYKASIEMATRTHQNIFIVAGGNWCSFCYRFEADLTEASLDIELEKQFVFMKANMGDGNDNRGFFSLFPKINGYPHIFIVSPSGNLLESSGVPSSESEFRLLLSKYGKTKA